MMKKCASLFWWAASFTNLFIIDQNDSSVALASEWSEKASDHSRNETTNTEHKQCY